MVPDIAVPGIQVQSRIGHGRHSVVYRGIRGGEAYAIKVRQRDEAAHLDVPFRREATILARVHHHGLAQIMEVGETAGRPYLVMEYVEGDTLSARLASGPLAEDEVISIAKQVVDILAAVHRVGIIHRDLSTKNIIIGKSGKVTLIDFGLATTQAEELPEDVIVGTFLYSPPEQTGMLRRPIDARSDLYSVGVILYECVAGHPPFQSNDISDLLEQHLTATPPAIETARPSVNPALAAIIHKLLAKDPDDRYQTDGGLRADLDQLDEIAKAIARDGHIILGKTDTLQAAPEGAPFIGREEELEACRAVWSEVRSGSGRMFMVEGQPGVGKSRLARELLRDVGPSDLVLCGKCKLADPLPFGPLREAIALMVRQIRQSEGDERARFEKVVREAAGDAAPVLKRFVPQLDIVLPMATSTREVSPQEFYAALARFFLGLAAGGGILYLFIDDVQWLDAGTHAVLKRITALMSDLPLLVVVTSRDDAGSQEGHNEFVRTFASDISARIRLKPLSREAAARLVAAHLGEQKVDDTVSEPIVARGEGSPFLIGQYVLAMLDAGLLRPSWGKWILDAAGLNKVALPTDVIELILRRSAALSDQASTVIRAASALGTRFSRQLLPQICEFEDNAVMAALDEGIRAGLIEPSLDDGYTFAHDRILEAFQARLDEPARQDLHWRIAQALEAHSASADEGVYLYDLAHHYWLGARERDPKRVYEANRDAGFKAMREMAEAQAYMFLSRAVQFAEAGGLPVASATYFALSNICNLTSRSKESLELGKKSLDISDDPHERARVHTVMAQAHMANQDIADVRKSLMQAFAELGLWFPRLGLFGILRTLKDWLHAAWIQRSPRLYGSAKGQERETYRISARLYGLLGTLYFSELKPFHTLQASILGMKPANLLGPCREFLRAYGGYVLAMGVANRRDTADMYAVKAIAIAEQLGDVPEIAHQAWVRGYAMDLCGRSVEAAEVWSAALEKLTLGSFSAWDATALSSAFMRSLTTRGLYKEAADVGIKSIDYLEAVGGMGKASLCYPNGAVGFAAIGNQERAHRYLDIAWSACLEKPNERYRWGLYYAQKLACDLEFGNWDREDEIDEIVETHRTKVRLHPITAMSPLRPFYVNLAYVRLQQCVFGDEAEKTARLARLRAAVKEARRFSNRDQLIAHVFVLRSALAILEGNHKKGRAFLRRAEDFVETLDMPGISFEIHRQRARMLVREGRREAAERQAYMALDIAARHGWRSYYRTQSLREEFGLPTETSGTSPSRPTGSDTSATMYSSSSVLLKRHLEALLQVSLASAGIVDPDDQARVCLDEIVRVLGAERAFLILSGDDAEQLKSQVGRDRDGNDLLEIKGHSTTVVERVLRTGVPTIIGGAEEAAAIGAESVIAHDLRSIMAAPLMLRGKITGVIYADSRAIKGLFTASDLDILTAIANHIAIALETARMTRLEVGRAALEKDLQLTAAIQDMFLPRQAEMKTGSVELAGFYRPASQCGGDWWTYSIGPNGDLRVFVGDATGHGAPAAMVTAAVAAVYRLVERFHRAPVPEILEQINAALHEAFTGKYCMAMSALEIVDNGARVRWWSAASPPLMILKQDGSFAALLAPSTALGTEADANSGTQEYLLSPGEQLLICSDGLLEAENRKGRPLGLRRLSRWYVATREQPLEDARTFLVTEFDRYRDPTTEQSDDLTFVILRRTRVQRHIHAEAQEVR